MIKYFLLFFTILSYGQESFEGKIYYKKKIETSLDFEDKTPMNQMHIERTNNLIKELTRLNYHLLIKNDESLFTIDDELEIDNEKEINLGKLLGGGKGIYYTNMSDMIMIHQKESFGKLFLIKHQITDLKWNITNETKIINGYNCIKAVTEINVSTRDGVKNQKIIAWFTPKINRSTGPIGQGGLPGLILEYKKGDFIFYAYKIKENNSKYIKIIRPTKGEKVSKIEFDNIVNEVFKKRATFKK